MGLRNHGFTLIETLIGLLVTLMIIALSSPLLKLLESNSYQAELETRQFFLYLQEEINHSTNITFGNDFIGLMDADKRKVIIEPFGTSIRRRVDDRGHELLLTEVTKVSFQSVGEGIRVVVVKEGQAYHKTMYLFP